MDTEENQICPIDHFCFVCGHQVINVDRRSISGEFKLAYKLYFAGMEYIEGDYTPKTVCPYCYANLVNWLHKNKKASSRYLTPVIWMEDPNGHQKSTCYACKNYSSTITRTNIKKRKYISTFTASLPVLRTSNDKPPEPPNPDVLSIMTTGTDLSHSDQNDPDYIPEHVDEEPQPLTQSEMDYIVAKLGLSQRNSEFLTSFLKRRKLTKDSVNATAYRKRQYEFQKLYTVDPSNTLTYCNDIKGLVNKLGMEYVAVDWRLFIDGSVSSLKAVLLHVTNKKPSVPVALGVNIKESYETLKDIMNKIKYNDHKWKICCDLKVVNILQGIINLGGYPKYFCYLCNYDSRSKIDHYQYTGWEKRNPENEKKLNLFNQPLIKNIDDILLPPLHIKLGIAKKLIEVAVAANDDVFDCLKSIFPKLSNAKIRAGIGFYSNFMPFNCSHHYIHITINFSQILFLFK